MACIDPTQLARHPHPHSRDAEGGEEGDEEGDQAEGREEGQEEHEEEGHEEEGLAEEVNGAVADVSGRNQPTTSSHEAVVPGVLRCHRQRSDETQVCVNSAPRFTINKLGTLQLPSD